MDAHPEPGSAKSGTEKHGTVFLERITPVLFRSRRKQFEDLVLTELGPLFRLAFRLTGNQSVAEDLVQETLLRAYRSFDKVTVHDFGLKPWLFKILHNLFFDELHARKKEHVLADEPAWELLADQHPESWPEINVDHVNWDQFDEEIKQGVEALAPEYRIVLLLWALEQLNYKEIADICNVPVGTVMSRLFRARRDLAHRLAGYARDHRLPGKTADHRSGPEVAAPKGS
jgi:RNA polymerase sigma-70 factor, ECF subfamily